MSVKVASTGLVQATVSLHGGRHTTEELAEAKCPILYLVAKGDSAFPDVDNVQAVLKEHPEKGSMKIFEGVVHGWVNRGSVSCYSSIAIFLQNTNLYFVSIFSMMTRLSSTRPMKPWLILWLTSRSIFFKPFICAMLSVSIKPKS